MNIIMSENEMFDDVRTHFSKEYNVISPKSILSNYKISDYQDEIIDFVKRLKNIKQLENLDNILKILSISAAGCFSIQDTLEKIHKEDEIVAILNHAAAGVPASSLFKIGNSLGIPTFVLQNGIWPKNVYKSHYTTAHRDPSTILCISEYMKYLYKKLGAEENKLILTGHPYFDRYKYFVRKKTDRPMVLVGFVLSLLECNTIGARIPWFQSPPMEYKNYFRIYDIARRLPEFDFVIKLKPHGLILPIHFFNSPKNVRAYNNSWFEWMDKASVVVGDSTTVVLESAFAGVPTIVPKVDVQFVDYMGAIEEVEWNVDNVVSAIKNAVNSTVDNKKFNEYYFTGNLDFNSTTRVINTIEEGICNEI